MHNQPFGVEVMQRHLFRLCIVGDLCVHQDIELLQHLIVNLLGVRLQADIIKFRRKPLVGFDGKYGRCAFFPRIQIDFGILSLPRIYADVVFERNTSLHLEAAVEIDTELRGAVFPAGHVIRFLANPQRLVAHQNARIQLRQVRGVTLIFRPIHGFQFEGHTTQTIITDRESTVRWAVYGRGGEFRDTSISIRLAHVSHVIHGIDKHGHVPQRFQRKIVGQTDRPVTRAEMKVLSLFVRQRQPVAAGVQLNVILAPFFRRLLALPEVRVGKIPRPDTYAERQGERTCVEFFQRPVARTLLCGDASIESDTLPVQPKNPERAPQFQCRIGAYQYPVVLRVVQRTLVPQMHLIHIK